MVISIIMVIVGLVTMAGLPIAQFPKRSVHARNFASRQHYVGADAQTIEQAVATPRRAADERRGQHELHVISINANNGLMRMFVNFDLATDPNLSTAMC